MHPWHVGVLWDRDPRMAALFMETFAARCRPWVADDVPRAARRRDPGALDAHAAPVELAGLAMEIRQGVGETPEGAAPWCRPEGDAMAETLAAPISSG